MAEHGFEIGDHVMVGKGTTVWTIVQFWNPHGEQLVSLSPVEGYAGTTVAVSRLRAVS